MKKINVKGLIVLLILVVVVCGVGTAWNIIVNLATGLWQFMLGLPQLVKPIIPFLGIENMAVSFLICGIILMIASGIGVYFSKKQKNRLWTGISETVEIISTIITVGSATQI